MANLLDRVLSAVGLAEEDYEVSEESFEKPIKYSERKQMGKKVVNIHEGAGSILNVLHPDSFDEARNICTCLRLNQAVLVNLENMNQDLAQRIVDFISGAVYSLDGGIKKISAGIFLVTPSSFIIAENKTGEDIKQEIENRDTLPWTN